MSGWSNPDTLREMSELEKAAQDRYADKAWEASVAYIHAAARSSDLHQAAMGRIMQRCLPSMEEVRRALVDADQHRGPPLIFGAVDWLGQCVCVAPGHRPGQRRRSGQPSQGAVHRGHREHAGDRDSGDAPRDADQRRASMKQPVEIRPNDDGSIDEIVARGCNLHIEQMSNDGWYMEIETSDGSYWQFWFGSKNRKSHVEFRHTETTQAPIASAVCEVEK